MLDLDYVAIARRAWLAIILLPNTDLKLRGTVEYADARTSMADLRTAINLAKGVPFEHIDPSTGYGYTEDGYADVRSRWREQVRSITDPYFAHKSLDDAREVQADYLAHRPELDASDWFPEHTEEWCEYCGFLAEAARS